MNKERFLDANIPDEMAATIRPRSLGDFIGEPLLGGRVQDILNAMADAGLHFEHMEEMHDQKNYDYPFWLSLEDAVNGVTVPPEEVDRMMPDYSIYPDNDMSIGFTTRGCNRNCYFCHVREKEGKFRRFQHPSEFHNPAYKKMSILDNNLLFDKSWFFEVTDWARENKVKLDYN